MFVGIVGFCLYLFASAYVRNDGQAISKLVTAAVVGAAFSLIGAVGRKIPKDGD